MADNPLVSLNQNSLWKYYSLLLNSDIEWGGAVTLLETCLPSIPALNLPGMMRLTWNPSSQAKQAEWSEVQDHPQLHRELKASLGCLIACLRSQTKQGMWWAAQSIISWFLLHLFGKRCLKPQSQTHRDWPNHRKGNVAELKACMSSPLIINFTMGTQGFDMDARATWLFSQPAQPQALPKST